MKGKRFLAWAAVLIMAILVCLPAYAGEPEQITGEWQHRFDPKGLGFFSMFDYNPFMTVFDDGTVQMTDCLYGREYHYEGTWRYENGFYYFRFNDYEELKFTLKNGVLRSIDYRGWFPLNFTKPYSKGELVLGVPIDAYHFPDPQFRLAVMTLAAGDDTYNIEKVYRYDVPVSKVQKIRELDVSGKGITSLKGIEYLTNLTKLKCDDNLLTELDLSGMANLTEVSCANNRLAAVSLDGCKKLKKLNCRQNKIVSLSLSECGGLTSLDCGINALPSLDLSACRNLKELDCASNSITSLDLSACKNLGRLDCGGNALPALDLSACRNLKELYCSANQIPSLDLEKNNALTVIQADEMPSMTDILLGRKGSLSVLRLRNTGITRLDVSGCGRIQKLLLSQKFSSLPRPLVLNEKNAVLETDGEETITVSKTVTLEP